MYARSLVPLGICRASRYDVSSPAFATRGRRCYSQLCYIRHPPIGAACLQLINYKFSLEWYTFFADMLILQEIDIAASIIAALALIFLALFLGKTKIGVALRAVADDHQAALSVGISLNTIWVVVWFISGIIALITGIMWGAKSDVSFALSIIAFKALPVLILGGFTSVRGAIVGGLIIGIGEKIGEFYWGDLVGGSIEGWLAYMIALVFLFFRPQGLFGEKIIERV